MGYKTQASPDWTDCPAPCLCKWTYGKKSALCSSANLTSVPTLNSDLQVLDLQHNLITYLRKDEFSAAGLLNLQRIYLKDTNIKEIHRDSFRDLKILVEVDLANNHISVIPRDTFAGNDRLKVLILSGNPLKQLSNEQFPSLPHLRSLELENCQIHSIGKDAFIRLEQLEKLNLRKNELEKISEIVFMPILNLKSLSLEGNPWRCDCELKEFRNWYLLSKLHSVALHCHDPKRLSFKLWQEIPADEFACPPVVETTDKVIRLHAGENITFGCNVKGDPEPEAIWLFRGFPIGTLNATHPDQVISVEVENGLKDKWINISLYNVTKYDSGDYSCVAKNFLSKVSENVSLFVQQEVVAVTLETPDSALPIAGLVGGSVFTIAITFSSVICICLMCSYKRRRKRHRRKGRIKSGSFNDQDKKLLDVSISTSTDRPSGTQSLEMFGSCHGDMKLPESSSSLTMEMCEPVQITIDRHSSEPGSIIPIAAAYPTTFGVYPPPVDFASARVCPNAGYGNIFISVSVSKDPFLDAEGYPDLLEIPCKGKGVGNATPEMSFCRMPVSSYATLPRRALRSIERAQTPHQPGPIYDRLGKRVTMQGSSTLSLPDAQNESQTPSPETPKEPPITIEVDEYVSL